MNTGDWLAQSLFCELNPDETSSSSGLNARVQKNPVVEQSSLQGLKERR